jgi:membrane protein YqaA with SNARE-associated domain
MNHALVYLFVFLASLGVDLIPFFGPPAWMAMVFFLTKYDLNPWLVLFAGVPGSVLGRYVLARYIPKLSDRMVKKRKSDELKFVGGKLRQKLWRSWLFVFIYSCLPMSTTALFMAAGMARISPLVVIPPFTLGKFASDALMVFGGHYVAMNLHTIGESLLSVKSIALGAVGLALLFALFFVDWRVLLQRHKLALNFKIWK